MTVRKITNRFSGLGVLFLAVFAVYLFTSSIAVARTTSGMSLLDNRFRVDPSISQVTFLIYRSKSSQPVVLVRPDGVKYYAWEIPDNVTWFEDQTMDVISIDNPMPGPWQAIGKVTPKNNITMVSHVTLSGDTFPSKVYKGEVLKFSAQLKSNGQPLLMEDFLDRVNLNVTFTKYVENAESLIKEARPIPKLLGTFADNGLELDEKAGDGVFTVQLPIDIEPGKYRVRITSGNGVFLRAIEQVALVYPNPLKTHFEQSRDESVAHRLSVFGEIGVIQKGSMTLTAQMADPEGYTGYKQTQVEKKALSASVDLESVMTPGTYTWSGHVNATESGTGRGLQFPLAETKFSIVVADDYLKIQRQQAEILERKRIEAEKQRILAQREAERMEMITIVAISNIAIFVLGILLWLAIRYLKKRKEAIPEMQLNMPKK